MKRQQPPLAPYDGDEFGLTSDTAVRALGARPATVQVHLRGVPPVKRIFRLSPPARRKVREEWCRKIFERVLSAIPAKDVVLSKKRPYHQTFTCTIAGKDITTVRRMPEVLMVSILSIEGRHRNKSRRSRTLDWYAVQARFAIQIEGQTKGMQSYEDRIIVVKALSPEDAERRLHREFRDYAAPYLNPYYELVRWKFERVLDVYQISDDAFDPKGTEVFSVLRERRMRPEFKWHPRWEKRKR